MPTLTNKILNDSFKLCLHETPDLNILVKIFLGPGRKRGLISIYMIIPKARKLPFVDVQLEVTKFQPRLIRKL